MVRSPGHMERMAPARDPGPQLLAAEDGLTCRTVRGGMDDDLELTDAQTQAALRHLKNMQDKPCPCGQTHEPITPEAPDE